MTVRLRRIIFTSHVIFAVGWLGAVMAYLVLALTGLTSEDSQMVRAAYLSMELIGWFAVVPLCLAALTTGLIQSLGTEWGLFRHYWILAKFILTVGSTIILLVHMRTVSRVAGMAREANFFSADLGTMRISLVVHAVGGLLVLLTATVLSIYKPWGRTPYGRSKKQEQADVVARSESRRVTTIPWGRYILIVIIGMVLLFVVFHLAGGGLSRH